MTLKNISIAYNKHYIDGQWMDGGKGERKIINPATEEELCSVPEGSKEEAEKAAQTAYRTFSSKEWKKLDGTARSRLLWKLAELIERDSKEIAALETMNMGKPIFESLHIDVPFGANLFRYYAGLADKMKGAVLPTMKGFFTYTVKEPVGVSAMLVPWNFPFLLTCWKLAPALASGCTAVIKPSPFTPLTALKLAALVEEAGFPKGSVQVVLGDSEVGQALIESPWVHKISFTGSTRVGKMILSQIGQNPLKRVTLELGGKSPNIIFGDCDLKRASQGACGGIFYNKGEICSAGSRLLVEKSIEKPFLEALQKAMGRYQMGDPFEESTRFGPQATKEHQERVLAYIQKGIQEGAHLLTGGKATKINGKGYFVEPTIFTQVTPEMTIAQEEIFGPVLSVIPFETEEEALEIANNNPYGLAAGLFTRDFGRIQRFAQKLRCGTLWVNTYNMYHPSAPFGGVKESGFGRELGEEGLEEFLETKTIWISEK
ncbi:MAG: aldehyde dehydrogenase family protein [Planctomycetota bacterium]|nr:MAG: aldehyde dehydrogenase family protein [Planctomycetota bacterium]